MESSARVHVHPLVLVSIIDSFERRNDEGNVIGTLLGTFDKGIIEVTSSYHVPYQASEQDVRMDFNHTDSMFKLERKVNRNERIVGWYATGRYVTEHMKMVHEDYYMQHYKDAIFLLVDIENLFEHELALKAYRSRSFGVPGCTKGTIFLPLDVMVECSSAENTAVHMMASSGSSPFDQPEMGDDLTYLSRLVEQVQKMLEHVLIYVDEVTHEKRTMDSTIGRAITQLIFSIPKLDPALIDDLINSSFRDLLVVTYLTNLMKIHLKLLSLAN